MELKKMDRKKVFIIVTLIISLGVITVTLSKGVINNQENIGNNNENNEVNITRKPYIERSPVDFSPRISKKEAINIIKEKGYKIKDPDISLKERLRWNKVYWEFLWEEKNGPVRVSVDANNGEILLITDLSEKGPFDANKKISKENLETFTNNVRKKMSIGSTTLSQPVFGSENTSEDEVEYSCTWKQLVDEYTVKQSYLKISFESNGHLTSYINVQYRRLSEKNVEKKISKSEAIKISKEKIQEKKEHFTKVMKMRVENKESIKTKLSMIRPYYPIDKNKNLYGDDIKLSWTIEYVSEVGDIEIYIDAETGEYIGMDYTR